MKLKLLTSLLTLLSIFMASISFGQTVTGFTVDTAQIPSSGVPMMTVNLVAAATGTVSVNVTGPSGYNQTQSQSYVSPGGTFNKFYFGIASGATYDVKVSFNGTLVIDENVYAALSCSPSVATLYHQAVRRTAVDMAGWRGIDGATKTIAIRKVGTTTIIATYTSTYTATLPNEGHFTGLDPATDYEWSIADGTSAGTDFSHKIRTLSTTLSL